MEIRALFEKIAKEYPAAKKQELKKHPLAKFIRTQVPKSFNWCYFYNASFGY